MSALMNSPSRETLKDTDRDNDRETRCKVIWCISLLSHCYIKRVPSWEAARNAADREAVVSCARRILSVLWGALERSMDDDFDITMFADLVAPVITMLSNSPCGRELVTAELVEHVAIFAATIPPISITTLVEEWLSTVVTEPRMTWTMNAGQPNECPKCTF